MKLWEVLVPTGHKMAYYWELEALLENLSRGYTKMPVADGCWRGEREKMIPYRFILDYERAMGIAEFVLNRFEQECVMIYLISSDTYLIKRREQDGMRSSGQLEETCA